MLHRSIMLHAEDRIHALITRLRESAAPPERQALLDELTEIEASVHEVAHSVVDYQHVMDELDDNILVADKDEVVLYVNDAYIRHTGIAPEQILGKRITELLETGTYFTDPTVPEVIRSRKKVMKLSSMFGRPDSLGFVTGVPIFDDAGEIQYVVACNRGVSTFKELRDNFVHFVEAVNNLQGAAGHVQMVPNSSGIVTPQMVGESPAIQRVYDLIENVRQTNILVADKDEVVLYVNDAYIRHTGIAPEQILGKRITELLETGTYFTDPTVPEVIRSRKKVMKLSSMFGRPDSLGFVTGVPIFDDAGEIQYVVACNRGVSTFKELRDNFVHFVEAVNNLQGAAGHVQMVPNSSGIVTPQMVGESPAIQRVYDLIENVRQTTATVLITGESGVGKELIADAIYRTSSRAEKPFIKVNCASIPASLFESELFGYERGSFSGANASGKQGLFEAANNGTLLLDEIGEMPMDMQAKLLRAIQNNEITRVGGIRPIKLDIRYIASTNCDLKKKVREGTFRSDLYYRLHVIPIQVPPLREREGDVARLSQHFVSEFNKQYHKNVVLSPENIELLENYSWPGNIRELRNVMEYLVVCCAPNGHVDNSYIYGTFDLSNQNAYVEYDPDQSLNDAITAYEKKYLENALRYARNLKEASQILNIDPSTVSRKLRQHGLTLQGK